MSAILQIGGNTRPYAVLGHPVRHTLSPVMQNAAFRALGLDAVYLALDVAPGRLRRDLTALADLGFAGLNVTVPLKERAFRSIARHDRWARHLGSVNTLQPTRGGWKGYSTDGEGFLKAAQEAFGPPARGLSVFVLGCGGAGRAVAIACAKAGAARVVLANRDVRRALRLARDIRSIVGPRCAPEILASPAAWPAGAHAADLVIQATSVGMQAGDRPLLPRAAFRRGQFVYDLIYNQPETALMKTARAAGAAAANGLGMLLHQGALSFSIWTGREAPLAVMRRALERAVYGARRLG